MDLERGAKSAELSLACRLAVLYWLSTCPVTTKAFEGFDRGVEWDSNSCNPDASWYDSDTILPHAFSTLPITSTELRNPLHNPINTIAIACLFVPLWLGTPIACAPVTES